MFHGRVSSGDTSVEKTKEDAERALNMASEFLRHWIDVFSRSKACRIVLIPNHNSHHCFPPPPALPSDEELGNAPTSPPPPFAAAAISSARFSAQYLCNGSSKMYFPESMPSTVPTMMLLPNIPSVDCSHDWLKKVQGKEEDEKSVSIAKARRT
eukprot:scaffold2154_cov169-Alexandrium_tamarense.AAC.7